MKVSLLIEEREIDAVVPVLLQLRPQYNHETLKSQIIKQLKNGYQVAYLTSDDSVICVAGFYVSESLAWKKHVYVDDLVTSENSRSLGAGRAMIDWLKQFAKKAGCEQLHLDSGVQRFAAHRFYLREGFDITSHHFALCQL
ncbi:GNAT family N-acetyltransferase [Pleionea sediminis]|uniref:GNAT family N-acetyltransferase n=1 Tax=Pleionea sediminis TaxID=2569479 RepID=UPI001185784C|nr:GNAT family N-acetyltransferase [Pleionea sediminis]